MSELIEITQTDIVRLAWFMADNGYKAHDIAYAVEKPYKHLDLIDESKRAEAADE